MGKIQKASDWGDLNFGWPNKYVLKAGKFHSVFTVI